MTVGTYQDAVALAAKMSEPKKKKIIDDFMGLAIWNENQFGSAQNSALFVDSLKSDPCEFSLDALNLRFWSLVSTGILRPATGFQPGVPSKYTHLFQQQTQPNVAPVTPAKESTKQTADDPYKDGDRILSSNEIRHKYSTDKTFKARVDAQENADFIRQFRSLTTAQQQEAYKTYSPEKKAVIDADYDRFTALSPEAQAAELRDSGVAAPPSAAEVTDPALKQFVEKYRSEPHSYSQREYQKNSQYRLLFDRAVSAGLI